VAARADASVEKLKARIDELEAELSRAERTSKALQEVGLALGSTLDLDQLLELILKKITELLDADRATLYLLDEQRKRLLSRIMVGHESRSIELPVGEGIAGYVAKVGRSVRVRDAYRDKRFSRDWDILTGYRTRSILAAPMKNHVGRTIGVIQVLNKRGDEKTAVKNAKAAKAAKAAKGAKYETNAKIDGTKRPSSPPPDDSWGEFSQHDEEMLSALATQAAVSIDNSRLFLSVIQKNMQLVDTKEQLEHRVSDLKLLFELESSMGRAATLEDLARAVVASAARACQARAGGLLVDEGEGGVWLYFVDVSRPPSVLNLGEEVPIEVKRLPVKRGEGILGWSMHHNQAASVPAQAPRALPAATGAIIIHDDDDLTPPASRQRTNVAGVVITSAIAVPLEGAEDAAIGGIALYNSKKPLGFSQDDRSLLRLVSANATTALQLFRSRMEQEKSERLSAIGRLISGVMHDMRTPLTVISGYAQLMVNAPQEATRNEYMRVILKQFDAMSAMQREVLEFARGERSILLRKVYLTKFFGDLETQLRQELATHNGSPTDGGRADHGGRAGHLELVVQLEDRGVARFDEAKITRCLHNLVRNAYEAMGERGGKVTVRVCREGTELVLVVADTGRGIPEEIQGRLFQSFVTSGKRGGTGLGLAIVKKIVDEHNGSITVDSTHHGATFTIRLPQDDAARTADLATTTGKSPDRAGA